MKALQVLRDTFDDFVRHDCPMMAAALSYYTVFSLPPLLLLIAYVAGALFGREAVEVHLIGQVRSLIGPDAAEQVQTMVGLAGEKLATDGVSLLVSIGTLLFAASGVLVQLQTALNRAWQVHPDPRSGGVRNFVAKRLLSFAAVVAGAFLLLVSLTLSAAISAFGDLAVLLLPALVSTAMLYALETAASIVLFTLVFAGMLRYLPDVRVAWRDVRLGAFVTATLVMLGKLAVGVYLGGSRALDYFGAAGSLAVIMFWVYAASMIVLFGAEFTHTWAQARGRPVIPQRGAIRYDRVERNLA